MSTKEWRTSCDQYSKTVLANVSTRVSTELVKIVQTKWSAISDPSLGNGWTQLVDTLMGCEVSGTEWI